MGKPIYVRVSKIIDQPLDLVWETVALGFGNVSNYNPEIKSSNYETEQTTGIGTRRHCDFKKSGYIKEEIVEWHDRKSFKLKFIESSVPMAHLESRFNFEDINGSTILVQEFWYRMKAPIGWLSGMMKGKMESTLESGLKGLENYLNS